MQDYFAKQDLPMACSSLVCFIAFLKYMGKTKTGRMVNGSSLN